MTINTIQNPLLIKRIRGYLLERKPHFISDFIDVYFELWSLEPTLEVRDFMFVIQELNARIHLDSFQADVDGNVLERMLEKRVADLTFHQLAQEFGLQRATERRNLLSLFQGVDAPTLDYCLSTYFESKGKWYVGETGFDDLIWTLKKLYLIDESHIESIRSRMVAKERADEESLDSFFRSPEYDYINKFYEKFGDSPEKSDVLQLQKLLKAKGHELSVPQITRLLGGLRERNTLEEIEKRVFSPAPESFSDAVYRLIEHYGENPLKEILRPFSVLLRNYGDLHIDEHLNNETLEVLIAGEIGRISENLELARFEQGLLSAEASISIHMIDALSGIEFEDLLVRLFSRMGYEVEPTRVTGDQGADLVMEKFGERIVVQAKRLTGTVGNKAVQEVVAARAFYSARKGMVVSNNYFTKSAKDLARANSIELIDRDILSRLVESHF